MAGGGPESRLLLVLVVMLMVSPWKLAHIRNRGLITPSPRLSLRRPVISTGARSFSCGQDSQYKHRPVAVHNRPHYAAPCYILAVGANIVAH